jgi:hypothetical protein
MQNSTRRLFARALGYSLLFAALATGAARAETVVVERPMPAPMVEHAPPPPHAGLNWVPGHWVWRNVEWAWAPGHYVETVVPAMPAVIVETPPARPSPAHVWVRGHWAWGDDHRWVWRPGVWFRP